MELTSQKLTVPETDEVQTLTRPQRESPKKARDRIKEQILQEPDYDLSLQLPLSAVNFGGRMLGFEPTRV